MQCIKIQRSAATHSCFMSGARTNNNYELWVAIKWLFKDCSVLSILTAALKCGRGLHTVIHFQTEKMRMRK